MKPITSLFHPAISLSIAGQLAIHLYCMVSAISMAKDFSTAEEIEEAMGLNADAGAPPPMPDAAAADAEGATALLTPFKPSLLNTVVFLIETAQQVRVRFCCWSSSEGTALALAGTGDSNGSQAVEKADSSGSLAQCEPPPSFARANQAARLALGIVPRFSKAVMGLTRSSSPDDRRCP